MEKILDRFLRYVSIDTQSNEESESQPSTEKQWNLLRMLRDELEALGVEATLDEFGYVMGSIPSNIDKKVPAVGFIAHVDTAPDASGADIKPQIVEAYDGGDIDLNLPLLVGGAISWYVSTRSKDAAVNTARQEKGTLIASGFIAGGALMGVVSAILRFANVDLFLTEWNAQYGEAIAIIPFVALIAYMVYASMKVKK